MFSGESRHSIDEKGRIIIPAKFRPFLQDGMFLTRGLDGCLFLFPLSIWNEIVQKVEELPLTNPTARAFSRLLLSGEECQMDKLGRILIPSHLREFAGLNDVVVIIGQGKRIEIWSEKRWNELVERFRKEEIPFAEQFRELGI
ncbi:MAG: division/cell wall cluster transcriptional repressor MraZ [Anaerolineae bacterium]|nr:division/cell wall cluster transcriptional repressor MraZ [Anaerolineae bacterium]MDW8101882.1 division/cell wall cluster transcriptional repressor MraZ [Anaerolineae bacterium]